MIEKITEEFNKYTSMFDKTNKDINLKYKHSFEVSNLMGELAFRLDLGKEKIELARAIGLLHDIGRFSQLERYKSYNDKNTDHAEDGADYLFKEGHIRDFLDDNKYDRIIEKAIRNHNKYRIEDGLNEEELLFSKMIRDMDKVDIFKQEAVNFENSFDASQVTEKVLKDFKDEVCVNKENVKTNTDNTLLVLSLIFDINFNESFDILVDADNFDLYLSMVEVEENSLNLWKKVREVAFDKINRGTGEENVR